MLHIWAMISPVLPQATRFPFGFQRHATANTLAHEFRLCFVSWSAPHSIFCRYSSAFPGHYYLNLTKRVLGNDVYCKQDVHGKSHLPSFHFTCNPRLQASQFGAIVPCIIGNRNLARRSTNVVLKVESDGLGGVLADQDTIEIERGGEGSQLEIEKQKLQARDLEALDPEETPNPESETVWESEVLIEDVKLLARFRSQYNLVQVLELSRGADHPLAGARVLLLDRPGNIQSVYDPYRILTNAYYDVLASLPPILPQGPIAIYGLGAGTIAHLLCHFWPGINIHGWELDPAVITVGRKFFCLSELEKEVRVDMDGSRLGFEYEGSSLEKVYASARPNAETSSNDYLWKAPFMGIHAVEEERHELPVLQKGKLTVHIGDALGPEAMVDGGFAGIIVDLFSKGAVLPSLQQTETWERMKQRLRPGGRIMVNCGGSCVESESKKDGGITMEETIATLARVFPGQLSKRVIRFNGDNCIALTGPIPDLRAWMRSLQKPLLRGVFDWETIE